MNTALAFIARWIHIVSAITLMGGVFFSVLAWLPGLRTSNGADAQSWSDAIAARFRPWALLAILGLLVSGFYNYWRHAVARDVPTLYHMVFGMKFLLALHVFTVSYLALNRGNAKRARLLKGAAISGLAIVVLSTWMRFLALSMLQPIPVH